MDDPMWDYQAPTFGVGIRSLQGCPMSGMLFAVATIPLVKELCRPLGGLSLSFCPESMSQIDELYASFERFGLATWLRLKAATCSPLLPYDDMYAARTANVGGGRCALRGSAVLPHLHASLFGLRSAALQIGRPPRGRIPSSGAAPPSQGVAERIQAAVGVRRPFADAPS